MDRLSRLLRPFLLGGAAASRRRSSRRSAILPGEAGLIVADRYDAAVIREAAHRPLAPARRKAELLHFARRAARRLSAQIDPSLGER